MVAWDRPNNCDQRAGLASRATHRGIADCLTVTAKVGVAKIDEGIVSHMALDPAPLNSRWLAERAQLFYLMESAAYINPVFAVFPHLIDLTL
jgi:hypothetical protein